MTKLKDQTESLKDQLSREVKKEILESDYTQKRVVELTGVTQGFLSNFMNNNLAGMKALGIPKLIRMANGLGLRIKLVITKSK